MKPLIIRNETGIIIAYQGKKLCLDLNKYKDSTDEEIIKEYMKERSITDGKKN